MDKQYKYYYRPGYGSDKLLIEFFEGAEDELFFKYLFEAIADLQPVVKHIEDLWMNDEYVLTVESEMGEFIYSKDIWGLAFIMGENNQQVIDKIDELLSVNPKFGREVWVSKV